MIAKHQCHIPRASPTNWFNRRKIFRSIVGCHTKDGFDWQVGGLGVMRPGFAVSPLWQFCTSVPWRSTAPIHQTRSCPRCCHSLRRCPTSRYPPLHAWPAQTNHKQHSINHRIMLHVGPPSQTACRESRNAAGVDVPYAGMLRSRTWKSWCLIQEPCKYIRSFQHTQHSKF